MLFDRAVALGNGDAEGLAVGGVVDLEGLEVLDGEGGDVGLALEYLGGRAHSSRW